MQPTWYMVLGRRKSDMLLITSSLEDSLSGKVLTLPCRSQCHPLNNLTIHASHTEEEVLALMLNGTGTSG